jgi:hypothetical protein
VECTINISLVVRASNPKKARGKCRIRNIIELRYYSRCGRTIRMHRNRIKHIRLLLFDNLFTFALARNRVPRVAINPRNKIRILARDCLQRINDTREISTSRNSKPFEMSVCYRIQRKHRKLHAARGNNGHVNRT